MLWHQEMRASGAIFKLGHDTREHLLTSTSRFLRQVENFVRTIAPLQDPKFGYAAKPRRTPELRRTQQQAHERLTAIRTSRSPLRKRSQTSERSRRRHVRPIWTFQIAYREPRDETSRNVWRLLASGQSEFIPKYAYEVSAR